jgi:hypothetical protein
VNANNNLPWFEESGQVTEKHKIQSVLVVANDRLEYWFRSRKYPAKTRPNGCRTSPTLRSMPGRLITIDGEIAD